MALLYGRESLVATFTHKTDVITMTADHTFPALNALTVCLWMATMLQEDPSSKTIFTYLPLDKSFDSMRLMLVPGYMVFLVNNEPIISRLEVSCSNSDSLSVVKIVLFNKHPLFCLVKSCLMCELKYHSGGGW